MILPDTSVWVGFLRDGLDGSAAALADLLETTEVATCGPVVAEVLAGAQSSDRARLWNLLRALVWIELAAEQWRRVGEVAAHLREAGLTVPLTDIEVAVAAVEVGASLWSWDTDFDRIATVMPGLQIEAG